MDNEKKIYRQLKRDIKKSGNRKRRNYFKRMLDEHPIEAHWDEFFFDYNSSATMNGKDKDATREDYRKD